VLKILGTFFGVMGALVLIGTIWCWGSFRATVVNIAAGVLLTLLAAAMLVGSRRMARREE
jgi:hypothetical protein